MQADCNVSDVLYVTQFNFISTFRQIHMQNRTRKLA